MTWGGRGLKNCDISSSVFENSAFFWFLKVFRNVNEDWFWENYKKDNDFKLICMLNKTQKNWVQDHSQMLLRPLLLKKTLQCSKAHQVFNANDAPKTSISVRNA